MSREERAPVKAEIKKLMVGLPLDDQMKVLTELVREAYAEEKGKPFTCFAGFDWILADLSKVSIRERCDFILAIMDLYSELDQLGLEKDLAR